MENNAWPIFVENSWISWKPLPGMDPGLGEAAMWIGAAHYAKHKSAGYREKECHAAAEKAAFTHQYRCAYN
jgi:hypothetical protein